MLDEITSQGWAIHLGPLFATLYKRKGKRIKFTGAYALLSAWEYVHLVRE